MSSPQPRREQLGVRAAGPDGSDLAVLAPA